MSNHTPSYLLLEGRLGRRLDRLVMKERGDEVKPRRSWSQISLLLHQKTGVHVTAETLRVWFVDLERERVAKATAAESAASSAKSA